MHDHVETILRSCGAELTPMLAKLDKVLFPGTMRNEYVDRYMVILRHPELRKFLTLVDPRLSPVKPELRLPEFIPGISPTIISDIERIFMAENLFAATDFKLELESLWSDSNEAQLKLGAALLCLAYSVDKAGGYVR